jgi:hypothetical protein
MEDKMIDKQAPPTLEQRIVSILANANAGSEAVIELLAEVEAAIALSDQDISAMRAKALDLTVTPDPKAAHDCIVGSELVRDQLKTVLPKLRDKLTAALESERHDKWLSAYRNAKTERDALASEFADTYPAMVSQLVDLFGRIQQCDQKCAEVNSTASALVGEHRRLVKTELHARDLETFSRDRPEIAKTVVLPDFDISSRMRWPAKTSTSFAAEFASSMAAPYHPGQHWAAPEVQQQRRAEIDKQHREMASYYDQASNDQEERVNREERQHRSR